MTGITEEFLAQIERDIDDSDVRVNADAEVFGEEMVSTKDYADRLLNSLTDFIIGVAEAAAEIDIENLERADKEMLALEETVAPQPTKYGR